jgi:hypothetical protein
MGTAIACCWCFYIIVNILFTAGTPSWASGAPCHGINQGSAITLTYFLLITFIHLCLYFGLAVKLVKYDQDAYSFRLESLLIICVTYVGFFLYLIVLFAGKASPLFYRLIFNTEQVASIVLTQAWPYAASLHYHHQQIRMRPRPSVATNATTAAGVPRLTAGSSALKDVLATDQGCELFMRHLTLEFASENLLFYKSVAEFKEMDSHEVGAIRDRAIDIYHSYIVAGAQFSVNISFHTTQTVAARIARVRLPTEAWEVSELFRLFNEAQEEVYNLMASDSFRRFQTSPLMDEFIVNQTRHSAHDGGKSNFSSRGDFNSREIADGLIGEHDGVSAARILRELKQSGTSEGSTDQSGQNPRTAPGSKPASQVELAVTGSKESHLDSPSGESESERGDIPGAQLGTF